MYLTFKDSKKKMEEQEMIDEMIEISKLVGGDGYILYRYYRSKRQRWKWIDTVIARDLGWSIDKLKRIRSKLQYNGLFYRFNYRGNTFTYVGGYNAVRGRIDKYIENGYSTAEAIAQVKHEVEVGEFTPYGSLPEYFDHFAASETCNLEGIGEY